MQNSEQLENQSTLGGVPSKNDLLAQSVRVRPIDFAKICGVSKQAVSAWIQSGKISIYPDGTLDPKKAAKEYIQNSDPARVKASVFKVITDDVGTLKNEIKILSAKISEQKNYSSALLGAFETIIETIKNDVFDSDGEFSYLNSLTDRASIENELNEIMSYDINNIETGNA
jgi:hypothetical protein